MINIESPFIPPRPLIIYFTLPIVLQKNRGLFLDAPPSPDIIVIFLSSSLFIFLKFGKFSLRSALEFASKISSFTPILCLLVSIEY